MTRPDQIPPEVAWKLHDKLWKVGGPSVDEVRAALAAAINAWPEVKRVKGYFTHDTDYYEPAIILPLPQEVSDE